MSELAATTGTDAPAATTTVGHASNVMNVATDEGHANTGLSQSSNSHSASENASILFPTKVLPHFAPRTPSSTTPSESDLQHILSSIQILQQDIMLISHQQRRSYTFLAQKLREQQMETARLQRKLREYDGDHGEWSLRYTRRLVLISNITVGFYTFFFKFVQCFQSNATSSRFWLLRLLLPSLFAKQADDGLPISRLLLVSFLHGVQSSVLFFLSALLHVRGFTTWRRNASFALSTASSLYHVLSPSSNTRAANYFNVFVNVLYVVVRYYYVYGLLLFNNMHFL